MRKLKYCNDEYQLRSILFILTFELNSIDVSVLRLGVHMLVLRTEANEEKR